MARTLGEAIAQSAAEPRGKIIAAHMQKLIAEEKKRRLDEAKRGIELDRRLIGIAVLITALPIVAVLAGMVMALAVGDR